jgi:hypothetical protein
MKREIRMQYASTPKTVVDLDVINSIPLSKECQKAFDKLSEGDEKPFQFIQELKIGKNYPATDGTVYTKEWAESYIAKANKKPIVGSAYGHEYPNSTRRENHLYLIGAKLQDDETVLLRHYVTNEMPKDEYNRLIKELKAGLLSTSVVSMNDYKIEKDKDGKTIWYATKSVGFERNDIVEWDQTGMVSTQLAVSQKSNPVENKEGASIMELEEAISLVQKSIGTMGVVGSVELAKKLGFQSLLKTEEMEKKASAFDELESKTGGLKEFVEKAIDFQKTNFEEIKKVALQKKFEGNEDAINFANDLIGEKPMTADELNTEIERVAGLASMKKILSQGMDFRNKETGTKSEAKTGGCFVSKEWG